MIRCSSILSHPPLVVGVTTPVRDFSLGPIWISFPKLPLQCYPVIHEIAGCLGRVLGMDQPTANLFRLSSARICVEVDLSRPTLDKI